ncbi:hypothetical protein ACLNBZ_10325, partial [Streptococcus pneumoniae]|uniref:hypothetical protein n=1 Tax=Streptococcus pneumoniae TaxID=1313 RepID=UPI00398EB7F2
AGQQLIVRWVDSTNYIRLTTITGSATWNIVKQVAGVDTFVGNIGVAGFTGNLTLRAIGNQISAKTSVQPSFSTYTVSD